ncbi:MAG TPA: NAD-binding protein [Chloroflexota bacterium]|nr:NAD-binding protein [Chloroflexota bacterium]
MPRAASPQSPPTHFLQCCPWSLLSPDGSIQRGSPSRTMFPFPGFNESPPEPKPALLATPIQIGTLTIANRVVMAPMTTGFATAKGLPSARQLAWYGARAAGGASLVIVEETLVLGDKRCLAAYPPRLRLSDDRRIAPFRRLARTIADGGAIPAIQLSYPGVADVAALQRTDLDRIVAAFIAACGRAKEAGFRLVELQALPSRLLGQLLSVATNRRRDRYGRTFDGRLRAHTDILAGALAAQDLPIVVRFSADERTPRGTTLQDASRIAVALQQAGVSALEIVGGATSNPPTELLSSGVGEATRADLASAISQAVTVPIFTNGRIISSDAAERVLREGQASVLSLGRALLADPAWMAKEQMGIELEVIPCISCMACFTPTPDGGTGCPVNGDAGREYLPPLFIPDAPRRVAILGANLPGLELARVVAARGHTVEISTEGLPLGGLLGLRAGVPGNAEFGRAFLYFGDRLTELGVAITDAPQSSADVTVDCRPGGEFRPSWANGKAALLAGELLGRDLHEMYGIGRRVAVAGPGALAAETALFLAGWGRRPTVVVPGPEDSPFPDVHPTHAARLLERLEGYKVPLVANSTIVEWIYDEDRRSKLVIRRRDKVETLEPFHTAVAVSGWPLILPATTSHRTGHPASAGASTPTGHHLVAFRGRTSLTAPGEQLSPWPQSLRFRPVPNEIPTGTTIRLGDTVYPEPLRDLVAYANLLGRVI